MRYEATSLFLESVCFDVAMQFHMISEREIHVQPSTVQILVEVEGGCTFKCCTEARTAKEPTHHIPFAFFFTICFTIAMFTSVGRNYSMLV